MYRPVAPLQVTTAVFSFNPVMYPSSHVTKWVVSFVPLGMLPGADRSEFAMFPLAQHGPQPLETTAAGLHPKLVQISQ